jgi:hypothetical protein
LRPETIVTHEFSLYEADEAYRAMNEGKCGKVALGELSGCPTRLHANPGDGRK